MLRHRCASRADDLSPRAIGCHRYQHWRRALNRIATDNSWREDSNSLVSNQADKSSQTWSIQSIKVKTWSVEILISKNKMKPSVYLENYKVFVCGVENLFFESNREWIATLKMGLNLPYHGKATLSRKLFWNILKLEFAKYVFHSCIRRPRWQ